MGKIWAALALMLLACAAPAANGETAATLPALDQAIAQKLAVIAAHRDESCNPAGLATLLSLMVDLDQFARQSTRTICPDRERSCLGDVGTRVIASDAANQKRLVAALAPYRWAALAACGRGAQHDAWLLVQHADDNPALQRAILGQMGEALLAGQARRADYAYLADRVAVNAGKPQLYGTQGKCAGAAWTPQPVAAPEGLDQRRHEMGLWTMAEYLPIVSGLCRPAQP